MAKTIPFNPDAGDIRPEMFVGSVGVDNSNANLVKGVGSIFNAALDVRDESLKEDFRKSIQDIAAQESAGDTAYRDYQNTLLTSRDRNVVNTAAEKMRKIEIGLEEGKLTPSQAKIRRNILLKDSINQYPWLASDFRNSAALYGGTSGKGSGQDYDNITKAQDELTQKITEFAINHDVDYSVAKQHIIEKSRYETSLQFGLESLEDLRGASSMSAALSSKELLANLRAEAKNNPTGFNLGNAQAALAASKNEWLISMEAQRQQLAQTGTRIPSEEWNRIRQDGLTFFDNLKPIIEASDPIKAMELITKSGIFNNEQAFRANSPRFSYLIDNFRDKWPEVFYLMSIVAKKLDTPGGREQLEKMKELDPQFRLELSLIENDPYLWPLLQNQKNEQNAPLEGENPLTSSTRIHLNKEMIKEAGRSGTLDSPEFQKQTPFFIHQNISNLMKPDMFEVFASKPDVVSNWVDTAHATNMASVKEDISSGDFRSAKSAFSQMIEHFVNNLPNHPEKDIWINRLKKLNSEKEAPRLSFNPKEGFFINGDFGGIHRQPLSLLERGETPHHPLSKLTQDWLIKKKYRLFKSPEEERVWVQDTLNSINGYETDPETGREIKSDTSRGRSSVGVKEAPASEKKIEIDPVTGNEIRSDEERGRTGVGIQEKNAMELIKGFEGYRDTAYKDTGGVLTIGYGTTANVSEGDKITKEEAEAYLMEDVEKAASAVDKLVKVNLTPEQRDALTSLVYNVGEGAFKKSRALKALNNRDLLTFLEEAFGEEKGFNKVKGETIPGLTKRRRKEMELFLSPLLNEVV